jgi:ubiquinone/menaquinone biosynthesis C-methylase UbiE
MDSKTKGHGNGHAWIAGLAGLAASVFMFVKMPEYKILTGTVLIFSLAHILAGTVLLASAWLLTPSRWLQKSLLKKYKDKLYFGWSYGWLNMYWIFFIIIFLLSLFVYLIDSRLDWISLLLLLISFQLFAGTVNLHLSKKPEFLTLPYVDLLSSSEDIILDAGCGGGRTTVALSRVMKNSRIVALDRFDSNYIENGGRAILERNLVIAGLKDKVEILQGDVTAIKQNDGYFDSAISSFMIDHLGKYKLPALKEIERVLKPGGKFLLIVFVPNWFTYSIFNIFCFSLTSVKGWRKMFQLTSLQLKDEGAINGGAYFLLQKNTK